jgi:hypothetical protein
VTWGPILGVAFDDRIWQWELLPLLFGRGVGTFFSYTDCPFSRDGGVLSSRMAVAWLERSWPRLVGPEIVNPVARPGFGGLRPYADRCSWRPLWAGVLIQQL